jgi:hypothetical protein
MSSANCLPVASRGLREGKPRLEIAAGGKSKGNETKHVVPPLEVPRADDGHRSWVEETATPDRTMNAAWLAQQHEVGTARLGLRVTAGAPPTPGIDGFRPARTVVDDETRIEHGAALCVHECGCALNHLPAPCP